VSAEKKKKRVSKKQILMGAVSSLMVLLAALSFKVNQSEKAYHVERILDGDTVVFKGGKTVRLLGINTAERGQDDASMSAEYLKALLGDRNVWLEEDRYEQDRYGRDLAWLWVGCESTPKFLASDFMIKTSNSHNDAPVGNPIGCKKGVLVNEQIIKMGWSKVYFLSKKGEMKYESRLDAISK
jgi:endonuclease YncB( thermonuclease family)